MDLWGSLQIPFAEILRLGVESFSIDSTMAWRISWYDAFGTLCLMGWLMMGIPRVLTFS
jgi:hypothetical protein